MNQPRTPMAFKFINTDHAVQYITYLLKNGYDFSAQCTTTYVYVTVTREVSAPDTPWNACRIGLYEVCEVPE